MYLIPRQNAPPSLAPPGVVVNYDNPDSIGDRIVVSNPLLGSLAFVFVALRVLIKWRVLKTWGWDDGKAPPYFLDFINTDIVGSVCGYCYGKPDIPSYVYLIISF